MLYVGPVWCYMLDLFGVVCWICLVLYVGSVWCYMLDLFGVICWICLVLYVGPSCVAPSHHQ